MDSLIPLRTIKLNIPQRKLRKLLAGKGFITPTETANLSQYLSKIHEVKYNVLHVESIVEKLLLRASPTSKR